jgi:hypothetical protein
MLNMSTFGNTVDVSAIVYFVVHASQHITVDHICYYCLLVANKSNYVHRLFVKKTLESFALYRRKNYNDPLRSFLLRIFKMFYGFINNPVFF